MPLRASTNLLLTVLSLIVVLRSRSARLINKLALPLQGLPMFKMLTGEDLEVVFDSFERKEHRKGDVLCQKGKPMNHVGILRMGDISASSKEPMQERGGFAFYGVSGDGLQEVSPP